MLTRPRSQDGALKPASAVLSAGFRPLGSCPRAAGWSAATLCFGTFGGHEIDHQLDFGRPGHGQDRRFGTFENADHGGFLRFRPWRSFSFSPELLIAVVSAGPAGP